MQATFVTLSKPLLTHPDARPLICKQRPKVGSSPLFWTITAGQKKIQKGAHNNPAPKSEESAICERKKRLPMPPETRKKISDALKGRRKSAEHRESLRRRFEGPQNPMYGRKRSAESRAKISRAMSEKAKQRKPEKPEKPPVQEEALDQLREKAMESRLITSVTNQPEKRLRNRSAFDELEAAHVDRILNRVARLEEPPESVAKRMKSNTEKRQLRANQRRDGNPSKQSVADERVSRLSHPRPKANGKASCISKAKKKAGTKCSLCKGTGLMACPRCVAAGIPNSRCESCFGAGGVFCETCNGVGTMLG
ncbi:unnamed protein product [Agarophyton chilense]